MKKYLYWNYYDKILRSEIIKETDFFYWLQNGERVSKKTMRTTKKYSSKVYNVESLALLQSYEIGREIEFYKHRLTVLLGMSENPEIRKQVLAIETKGTK